MSNLLPRLYLQINLGIVSSYVLFRLAEGLLNSGERASAIPRSFALVPASLALVASPADLSKRIPFASPSASAGVDRTAAGRGVRGLPGGFDTPFSKTDGHECSPRTMASPLYEPDGATLFIVGFVALLLAASLRNMVGLLRGAIALSEIFSSGTEIKRVKRVSSSGIESDFGSLLGIVGTPKMDRLSFADGGQPQGLQNCPSA